MNVLEFRQQCLGITRDEFARLVGCSYPTVYSWEERGIKPGGAFATILNAFEVAARHEKSKALLLSCARDGVGLADVLRDLFEFWGDDRNWPEEEALGQKPSPLLCEHANERGRFCPCPHDCYCKQNGNTCAQTDGCPL